MKRLHNKVAVITGACSGIGLATTELFLSEGAHVVAADVQDDVGQHLQAKYAGQLHFAHCDVTKLDELQAAIDSAAAHFGGLDILFSNAGRIGTMGGVQAFNPQAWDNTQHLLLRSVAAGTSYAVPHMVKRGAGAIVNTSSISALQAGYAPLAYSVAKAGVLHYTSMPWCQVSLPRASSAACLAWTNRLRKTWPIACATTAAAPIRSAAQVNRRTLQRQSCIWPVMPHALSPAPTSQWTEASPSAPDTAGTPKPQAP